MVEEGDDQPSGRTRIGRSGATALALLIGAGGGALASLLAVPLAWLLGALAATTLASCTRIPLHMPDLLRRSMIAVVGVMLGSAFTAERLEGALLWLPSLAALPLYIVVVAGVIYAYMRTVSGFDRRTTFFAATPGGLSEMIALADHSGGDVRRVSLIHATRLTFIVFTIPWLASFFGADTSTMGPVTAGPALTLVEVPILAGAAVVGYWLGVRLGLPAAPFVGPLLGSTVVHLVGWVHAAPPFILLALAQVVIGSGVGVRFAGVPLALVLKALLLGAGATLLMLVITAAFALVLVPLTGYSLALLLLAFIPGGFTEMSLIALAMGVDPAFVVTHHSLRVFLVISIAVPVYAWLERRGWFDRSDRRRAHEPAE